MKLIVLLAGAALALLFLNRTAHGANFRWASSSNRIYVENGGSATLTDIKTALPNAPLDLVDPVNKIWLLRANLQIEDGSILLLYGTKAGGDVDQLRLQSNNSTNAGSFVTVIADWGSLDIRRTAITSWDAAVNGPDTEFETFGRAFIRVRSRLAPDGVTPLESRMDLLASDISYLGYDASESYGLSWKVIGTHPDPSKSIYDFVKVYGNIHNTRIHHNFWAVYTYGLKDSQWLSNELDHNAGYGFDLHDDSDNILIEGNDVHHNGGLARGLHGIIASRRCDRLVIRNNRSWANAGNGIMLHRHCDDCLVENNNSFLNADSGVSIFDSDRNIVRNNLIMSNANAGIRVSVGATDNRLEQNQIGYSGKNGLYFFSGTDPAEPDPVDPTLSNRLRRNTVAGNYIHHCRAESIKIGDSDNNLFIGNVFEANAPELAVWTSTMIRFISNSIPPSDTFRLFGSPSLSNATTTVTTTVFFEQQPLVKLSLADALTSATFEDKRGAIFDFTQPEVATRVYSTGAVVTVTTAQIGNGTTATMRNLFVSLDSGEARVNPTLWTVGGDSRKQWTVQPPSATTSIRYTAGDMPPYTACTIQKNGQALSSVVSDEAGRVSFADVAGTTATIQYAVVTGSQPPTQPTVTLAATDATASETAPNPATFTFSRTGSTTNALTVRYSVSGTAANGTDYTALSGSLTIAAGSPSAVLTVTPINDAAVESNETVVITVATDPAYLVGSPSSAIATIVDNDQTTTQPTVTVVAGDANASETIPNPATFIFARTGSTAAALAVRYSVGGTAVNGTDYMALSGSLTIPAGSPSAVLTVFPTNDTSVESNETVVISVATDPAYLVGSPNSATATIVDNDQPPTQPTVTVVATDATGSETAPNPVTFTFSRTGSTAAALAVRYSAGGTAVNGTDYTALFGSLTIAAGSSSAVVTVTPINDTAVEENETVVITLTADAAYLVGSPGSATATITDNDQPPTQPTVTVVATDSTGSETAPNPATFTFSRTGSTAAALAVRYSVGGTAVNGTDYTTLFGSLTIAAGSPSAALTVSPINDTAVEGNETVVITLTADAAYLVGSPSSATATITDNDQPPTQPTITVVASDASGAETGPNPATFTFTRSGNTAAAMAVSYSVGGTAANGTDYGSLSGSLTIPAGSLSATVSVSPIDDTAVEGNETVVLTLSAGAGYLMGSPSIATATISDNDQAPPTQPTVTVVATDASGAERNQGINRGRFTFTRTGSTAAALAVTYSIGGTAANGTDYQSLSGSVTIPAGRASARVDVDPINDELAEGNETVVLTVTSSGAYVVGSQSSATVTIADRTPSGGGGSGGGGRPTVTVVTSDASGSETGPNSASFTFTRSEVNSFALTVRYTLGGTAANGTDYAILSGVVAIPAGSASRTIIVNPIDDAAVEGNETVVVTLSADTAYVIGSSGNATVTIADNDQPPAQKPMVSVFLTDLIASESGPDPGAFTVTRTGSTTTALTVHYSLGGTAVNGTDYQSLSGSVTIPAGADSAAVVVQPVDDNVFEVGELVVFTLTPNASYDVLIGIAALNILDNDSLLP